MLRSAWKAGLSLALAALLGISMAHCAQAQSFEEDVPEMVNMVLEFWNNQDPERLARLFTEKADLHSRTGKWYTGHGEIAGYFEQWMAEAEGSAKDIGVQRARQLSDNLGVVDVISSLTPPEGERQQTFVSVVVERQLDGSWLFASWRECSMN